MATQYKFHGRSALLNCERRVFSGVGEYGIPEIQPVEINDLDQLGMLGFNYALNRGGSKNEICHFYLEDYQFERVWKEPPKYLNALRKFRAVLAPDFSIYTDHPKAVQIFNHYRKHWCAAYWQENGLEVVPTLCWGDESTYDWCFDGEPHHALVCVSCIDMKGIGEAWTRGYLEAVKRLEPSKILLFRGLTDNSEIPDVGIPVVEVYSGNLVGAKVNKVRRNGEPCLKSIYSILEGAEDPLVEVEEREAISA